MNLGARQVLLTRFDGVDIFAFVVGMTDARNRVLFVHGWSGSGAEFIELAKEVVARTPDTLCISVDLPGTGASGKPADAPYTIPYFRKALGAIADAAATMGLPEGHSGIDLTLVGHSLGGHLAVDYAVRDGRRVRQLGLLAPAGWPGEIGQIKLLAAQNDLTVDSVPKFINETTYLTGHRLLMATGAGRYPEDAVRYAGRSLENPAAKSALKKVTRRALENDHIDDILHLVNVPTFVVWGRQDLVLSYAYAEKFLSRLPAGTIFEGYDNCGHAPHFDRIDDLAGLMAGFIVRDL